ncbi:hypothetical protein FTX61_05190 [Nitriliruptoraceae bacterium ZYF776]|nr:hypothetical protein [Profundirhabdus halotolerans]
MSSRPRRALRVVSVLVVLTLGGLVAAVVALNASLEREDVVGLRTERETTGEGDDATAVDHTEDAEVLNLLVLGSDSREVLTPQERRELSTGDAEGERTETIALLRLEPGADELRMLNIPRDSLVTRCDGSRGRVNAAYGIGEREGIGGTSCVVQTLTDWLGVEIDHTVKADFRGFVDIVDALGGVTMYLEEPLSDDSANLDLPAGCVTLDGPQALAFVRARHIDDDYGRVSRQQRFVEELRREIAGMGILGDVPQTVQTVTAVTRSLSVDRSLTLGRIQQLAREHRETVTAPIEGRVLPGTLQTGGIAFLDVDEARAAELVTWFLTGDDPAERDAPRSVQDGPGTERDGEVDGEGSSGFDGVDPGAEDATVEPPASGGGYGDGTDRGTRAGADIPTGARCG